MKNIINITIVSTAIILAACSQQQMESKKEAWVISAPAKSQYVTINKTGTTVIPNGRLLTPLGKQIVVAPHPFGLALSPDGKTIVTANSGTGPFSISIINDFNSTSPIVKQIPDKPTDKGLLEAVFMGLAISPDNKKVYVAGGQLNKVVVFDITTGKKLNEIDCSKSFDDTDYQDGYIGDMVMTKDGSRLYAVDQIGFRMIIIDTKENKVIANVKTGRYPFGITLSPDEKNVYVANVGMFEYSYVKTLDRNRLIETSLPYPAFGYGSKEMEEGIKNDSVEVAGLGDPNVPESFSVWNIDVSTSTPQVVAKIKTGVLVGETIDGIPAVGGSSPNSLVATNDFVFVSNGNNDNISVIDVKQNKVIQNIELKVDERLGNLKGVIPFGLALSPDNNRLFIAEAGINAVAVIDVASKKLIGHLPTGWFPSKLKVSPDGKQLIVVNAKGFGSGPNGGKEFEAGPEGSYIGSLMKGTVSIIDIPADSSLTRYTNQVVSNNFSFSKQTVNENPIPEFTGQKESPIKYIVFISKENRTYDEVFAQVKQGNGDTTLARFGKNAMVANESGNKKIASVTVMPNHLALAEQFAISDNFYVDADVSADGHRWLSNTYPNEWMETHHPASYGGQRNLKADSKAPGKFAFTGAAGAIFPEDYNQHGSMWDHLHRNNIEFYNYGFGVEFDAGGFSDSTFKFGGVRYLVNYPTPGPLYDRTSRMFPTYNMAIPDQFRADIFMKEYKEKWLDKSIQPPKVLTLQLLNDHGARERAHAGYPFVHSYMADNDLALGRVVEFLSNTPYWKEMLIVVTEDDAQGGVDHIDAHRSLLLIISPYTKKNYVSHQHYSFGSIFKTFWNVLGIPYLNQYDAGATDLADAFTNKPDLTPFKALPIDPELFDPQKALDPFDEKFEWEAAFSSPEMDNVQDMLEESRKQDKRREVKQEHAKDQKKKN